MQVFNQPQRTAEWYALRRGCLTASDAATISANGIGLETLCLRKALELCTGIESDSYTNEDIERGIEQENEARALYSIQTGNTVTQVGFIMMNHLIGCSPDGLVGEDGLTEFKCLNNLNHFRRVLGYKISREHYSQCQMQLLITKRKWNDYVCYNRNFPLEKRLVIERVYPDQKEIDKIKAGLERGHKLICNYLKKFGEKK